jgi:hypothetical protein
VPAGREARCCLHVGVIVRRPMAPGCRMGAYAGRNFPHQGASTAPI